MDRRGFLASVVAGALAGPFAAIQGFAVSASYELTNTVTADGTGVASITFQAPNVGPRGLNIASIALFVSGSSTIPQCTAYRNLVAPQNVLARKTAGDRGTFIGTDDVLYMGQQIVLQWTGATPGAQCTATLRGSPVAS